MHQSLIWVSVLMVFPKPSWISNDSVKQSQVLPCDRSGKVHAAHIACLCRWKVWGTEFCSRLSSSVRALVRFNAIGHQPGFLRCTCAIWVCCGSCVLHAERFLVPASSAVFFARST
mmetsp:Transcript_167667/g.533156  ORF Transcript_167667/g.533156 Transcript_167667/m.533156 type:complete len:116 (-) Transcript_167667:213-560(-)